MQEKEPTGTRLRRDDRLHRKRDHSAQEVLRRGHWCAFARGRLSVRSLAEQGQCVPVAVVLVQVGRIQRMNRIIRREVVAFSTTSVCHCA